MNDLYWEVLKDKVRSLALKGKRMDGRDAFEYRAVKIEKDIYHHADGSAFVELGETKVAAGVKFELGSPFPDTPEKGAFIVDAELLPIASPTFEPGPPDENAVELARVVDRGIRESEAICLEDLCIREGELVWLVFADIRVLDDGGNLFDAASMAVISALMDARIPRLEDDQIVRGEYEGRLKIKEIPVLTTFAKISGNLFADPSSAEEKAMSCRLSVATVDDGSITALQKGGSGPLSAKEIETCVEKAQDLSKHLRKKIKEAVESGKD